MKFRPCIDIHNGKVKQIVGSSLKDEGDEASENFVSEQSAKDFAEMYMNDGLKGGHIILLNHKDSEYYEATREQALSALKMFPGGMQIGGGITADNAMDFINAGASHVIVTSYVFKDGKINYVNLDKLVEAIGREHLVLDLSCKKLAADPVSDNNANANKSSDNPNSEGKNDNDSEKKAKGIADSPYYIVTDRWQNYTKEKINFEILDKLSYYCDEFLIHAADVEGKAKGIEEPLVELLGNWLLSRDKNLPAFKITYAGGIKDMEDIEKIKNLGHGLIDYTVGSALDLFGGELKYDEIKSKQKSDIL